MRAAAFTRADRSGCSNAGKGRGAASSRCLTCCRALVFPILQATPISHSPSTHKFSSPFLPKTSGGRVGPVIHRVASAQPLPTAPCVLWGTSELCSVQRAGHEAEHPCLEPTTGICECKEDGCKSKAWSPLLLPMWDNGLAPVLRLVFPPLPHTRWTAVTEGRDCREEAEQFLAQNQKGIQKQQLPLCSSPSRAAWEEKPEAAIAA